MSFISHDLKGAIVTWKDDTFEHCNGGPWDWPFKEGVTQATVVGVWINTQPGVHHNMTMLVLKAPNGDLGHFVGNGACVVGGDSKSCEAVHSRLSNRLFKHLNRLENRVEKLEVGLGLTVKHVKGLESGGPADVQGSVSQHLEVPQGLWDQVKAEASASGARARSARGGVDRSPMGSTIQRIRRTSQRESGSRKV